MNDPQQELFAAIKVALENNGYDVYDGFLPPKNTPYPFIYLGHTQQIDNLLKHGVTGNIYQTIQVWSNKPRERGTLSNMILDIKRILSAIENTKSFSFCIMGFDQDILPDNTTSEPLLYGVIETRFSYS